MPKRRIDPEVSAIEWILTILRKLDPAARLRVLDTSGGGSRRRAAGAHPAARTQGPAVRPKYSRGLEFR